MRVEKAPHSHEPSAIAAAPAQGWVSYASWLADDVLAVLARFPGVVARAAWFERGGERLPAEARVLPYPSANGATAGDVKLVVLTLSDARREPLGTLMFETEAGPVACEPVEFESAITDLTTLLREGLAWLDPTARAQASAFLAGSAASGGGGPQLSRRLARVREALRERLPVSKLNPTDQFVLNLEYIVAIDESAFMAQGWLHTADVPMARLTAVSPEGTRVELTGRLFRFARPDVAAFCGHTYEEQLEARSGFIAYFETPEPSLLADGWLLELRTAGGDGVEAPAPRVVHEVASVRDVILGSLMHERLPNEEYREHHVRPALTRLEARRARLAKVRAVKQFGEPPQAPEVTIVVPLYGRVDFLEQQLAQFAHDPEIAASDLVYIVDSPELGEHVEDLAAQLLPLYRVPLRVASLAHNGGFSVVNNVGADLGRGRLLLLLNSDILPDRPGWLGKMVAFHTQTPGIGALAPKLVYEDESLQHAGLYFDRMPGSTLWSNEHFYKGLHRSLPAADVARPVPAATAACMLIDRELYRSIGGLRGMYVQGDYEDSDLCLRLNEAGYSVWYFPGAELYHLEGQSFPSQLRKLSSQYNRWLHTRLWGQRIERVMAEFGVDGPPELR